MHTFQMAVQLSDKDSVVCLHRFWQMRWTYSKQLFTRLVRHSTAAQMRSMAKDPRWRLRQRGCCWWQVSSSRQQKYMIYTALLHTQGFHVPYRRLRVTQYELPFGYIVSVCVLLLRVYRSVCLYLWIQSCFLIWIEVRENEGLMFFFCSLDIAEKREALKAELERLKGDPTEWKRVPAAPETNSTSASKGSITLQELRLPLKADFVCSTANRPGSWKYILLQFSH